MRSTLLGERRWERGESEWVDADLIVIDTRRRGETNSANCCVCVLLRLLQRMRWMTLVDPRSVGSLLSYRQMEKRHFGAAAIDCSPARYGWRIVDIA
jgi:hypothetical protein